MIAFIHYHHEKTASIEINYYLLENIFHLRLIDV